MSQRLSPSQPNLVSRRIHLQRDSHISGVHLFLHYGDIADLTNLIRLLYRIQPDEIYHLAAQSHVRVSCHIPEYSGDVTGLGTVRILEAIREIGLKQLGVQKFVAVGTVCAYPKSTPVPFREDDLWNGYPEETNAPYGLAKEMMLVQAQAYRARYGFNAIYLLPVNLYGPRDNFDLESFPCDPRHDPKVC